MKRKLVIAILLFITLLLVVLRLSRDNSASPHPESAVFSAPSPAQIEHPHRTPRPLPAPDWTQINALLAAAESQADPDLRAEAVQRAIDSIANSQIRVVLDYLAGRTNPASGELRGFLVRRWAESDPPDAAAWVAQLPDGDPDKRQSLESVAVGWANADLPAATNWLQSLPENANKANATLALAYEATRTDPVTALTLANQLPSSLERDELLAHAVGQWAVTNDKMARSYVEAINDPGLRHRLVSAVAIATAEQDGPAAAMLVVTSLEPGEEQNRTAVAVAQRWAQQSPEAAESWVLTFPDEVLRRTAVQNLHDLRVGTVGN